MLNAHAASRRLLEVPDILAPETSKYTTLRWPDEYDYKCKRKSQRFP